MQYDDRPLTPMDIEVRLHDLSNALTDAHADLSDAEYAYQNSKVALEVAMARSRIKYGGAEGRRMTVQEKEDMAVVDNEVVMQAHAVDIGVIRACRANVDRLKVQIDVARSQGSLIRSAIGMG